MDDVGSSDKQLRSHRLERSAYLDERRRYLDGEAQSASQYDRMVATGAGGALALSIAFLEKIAPTPAISTRPLLVWAWVLLVVALGCAFASQFGSQYAWRTALEKLDSEYTRDDASHAKPLKNRWDRFTALMNLVAGVALIGGVSLLTAFAICNAGFTE